MNTSGRRCSAVAILALLLAVAPRSDATTQTQTITDVDGDKVTIRLRGPGLLTVVLDDPTGSGRGPIKSIALDRVSTASALTLTVQKAGDGFVTIENITADGPLKSIVAPAANLVGGGLSVTGSVGNVTLGNVSNAALTFTGAGVGFTGAKSQVRATVVKSLTVSGVMSNVQCSFNGSVKQVLAAGMLDSVMVAGFKPGDPSFPMAGGVLSGSNEIRSVVLTGSIGSTNVTFANSLIAAQTVRSASLGIVAAANNGVAFGIIAGKIGSVSAHQPQFQWKPNGPAVQAVADFTVNQFRGVLPSTTVQAAGAITPNSALLAGTVNPNGLATTAAFQWGTAGADPISTPLQAFGSGAIAEPITAALAGLNADTLYRFRLVARNSTGLALTREQIFSTGTGGVVAIAGGWVHSLALKGDGTVWAWGANDYGQLGDGTTNRAAIPIPVRGLSNAVAIACGAYHSLALRADGTVWTWGRNFAGQSGTGQSDDNLLPVIVVGLSNVVSVAAGSSHSLAVRADNTVWAWGVNEQGELGDGGTAVQRTLPVQSRLPDGAIAAAGGLGHSVAVTSGGIVWAWGLNSDGQLGNGTMLATTNSIPVPVQGIDTAITVASGLSHVVALAADGTAFAWGAGSSGQLGDGVTNSLAFPLQVSGLSDLVTVAAGAAHSIAVQADGTVWTWGANDAGQLGDGTTNSTFGLIHVGGLGGVVAVAGGGAHTIALRADGTVWTWGANDNGQLGDGGAEPQSAVPVQVQGLTSGAP